MKFDAATIREELSALEAALKANPKATKSLQLYLSHARKLRELEFSENGYVTARSNVTGY